MDTLHDSTRFVMQNKVGLVQINKSWRNPFFGHLLSTKQIWKNTKQFKKQIINHFFLRYGWKQFLCICIFAVKTVNMAVMNETLWRSTEVFRWFARLSPLQPHAQEKTFLHMYKRVRGCGGGKQEKGVQSKVLRFERLTLVICVIY